MNTPINKATDCYIAGPRFTPEAMDIVETIKSMLFKMEQSFFSPKDDCLFDPKKMTPSYVLDINIAALKATNYVIVITDGQDAGTLFEAGWCYAKDVPIIYVWLGGKPEDKFNIVLAASGAVCRDFRQLENAIQDYIKTDKVEIKNWGVETEYE